MEDRARKKIDLETWPRRSQYEFFSSFGWPFLDLCVRVDMTERLANRPSGPDGKVGVFATCMHAIMGAVQAVPEFRQRIEPDGIFEYERCTPSFTVMGEDGVFNYAVAEFDEDLLVFAERIRAATQDVRGESELNLDEDHRGDLVFVTCLPWLDFTSVSHPRPMGPAPNPADASVPRIAWGKIVDEGERKVMSVAVSAHHGLVDGVHLANFYKALEPG